MAFEKNTGIKIFLEEKLPGFSAGKVPLLLQISEIVIGEEGVDLIIKISQQFYFLFYPWILVNDFPEILRRAEQILGKRIDIILKA